MQIFVPIRTVVSRNVLYNKNPKKSHVYNANAIPYKRLHVFLIVKEINGNRGFGNNMYGATCTGFGLGIHSN